MKGRIDNDFKDDEIIEYVKNYHVDIKGFFDSVNISCEVY